MSSVLDDCQQSDSMSLRIGAATERRGDERGREATYARVRSRPGLRLNTSREVLRTRSRGIVEIAFEDEDRYVIVEAIAAEIRSGIVDIGH